MVLEAAADAARDTVAIPEKWQASIFVRWATGESPFARWWKTWAGPHSDTWRNKYRNGDPLQGPKFPGATTWLSWLTDGWHFFKFVEILAQRLMLGCSLAYLWPDKYYFTAMALISLSTYFLRGLYFEIFYRFVLPLKSIDMKRMLQSLFASNWTRAFTWLLSVFAFLLIGDQTDMATKYQLAGAVMIAVGVLLFYTWLNRPGKQESPPA